MSLTGAELSAAFSKGGLPYLLRSLGLPYLFSRNSGIRLFDDDSDIASFSFDILFAIQTVALTALQSIVREHAEMMGPNNGVLWCRLGPRATHTTRRSTGRDSSC